jgi:glycerol-3-phosphate dehydrogenase (NAD(P)+)
MVPSSGHNGPVKQVGVVGGGAWGTTLAAMLSTRAATTLWAREDEVVEAVRTRRENTVFLPGVQLPAELHVTADLAEAVLDRDVLVIAVPAQHVRSVGQALAPMLAAEIPLISLAKGIERDTLLRPSEVLADVIGPGSERRIGVVSGPNLAREVAAGQPSATVLALPNQAQAGEVQRLLTTNRFRVYVSDDVVGCEIGGAVKNVVAIAAGMAEGLELGWNSRAALITRGLAELTVLGTHLGGNPLTFLGLAGSGDLVATCSSPMSRNRTLGAELGRGRTVDEATRAMRAVVEGVATAPSVVALAQREGVEMPICAEVVSVLAGERTPADALEQLMGRAPTTELHGLPAAGDDA